MRPSANGLSRDDIQRGVDVLRDKNQVDVGPDCCPAGTDFTDKKILDCHPDPRSVEVEGSIHCIKHFFMNRFSHCATIGMPML